MAASHQLQQLRHGQLAARQTVLTLFKRLLNTPMKNCSASFPTLHAEQSCYDEAVAKPQAGMQHYMNAAMKIMKQLRSQPLQSGGGGIAASPNKLGDTAAVKAQGVGGRRRDCA